MASMATGVGAMTWSPLACGIITGKYENGIPESSRASMKVGMDLSLFHWGLSPLNSLSTNLLSSNQDRWILTYWFKSNWSQFSLVESLYKLSLFMASVEFWLIARQPLQIIVNMEKYLPVRPFFHLSVGNCNFQSSNWNENVQQIFNQSQNYSTGTTFGTLSSEERWS